MQTENEMKRSLVFEVIGSQIIKKNISFWYGAGYVKVHVKDVTYQHPNIR